MFCHISRLCKQALFHVSWLSYDQNGRPYISEKYGIDQTRICCQHQRAYICGWQDRQTEISISRVFEDFPDDEIFTAEETKALSEVTRADFLDLANVLGSADEITGLARFESNRLAIFTNDQTIVFKVDPDYTQREIDNRANVQLGAISHNGIVQVGSDVIFCSRHGVHSLIRSAENGLTIDSRTLSYEVETLYKQLLKDCIGPRFVTATYDQDLGRLHIFFSDGEWATSATRRRISQRI